jgi:hypothetical protein
MDLVDDGTIQDVVNPDLLQMRFFRYFEAFFCLSFVRSLGRTCYNQSVHSKKDL